MRDAARRLLVVLVALILAFVAPPGSGAALTTATAASDRTDYFALGDSVAAGRGLMDDGSVCRRSQVAYPAIVARLLAERSSLERFQSYACSGATAAKPDPGTLAASKYLWLNNQVDEVLGELRGRQTLVSITIGANDLGWSDPANFVARLSSDPASFAQWLEQTALGVEESLTSSLTRLLRHPNVSVVLTQYYNPVNRASIFLLLACKEDCYWRTDIAVQRMNLAFERVRAALPAALRSRVGIAPVYSAFKGHESPQPSCGFAPPDNADTWIQYRDDPNSNSNPFPGWTGDCFHPNFFGAIYYAASVNEQGLALIR